MRTPLYDEDGTLVSGNPYRPKFTVPQKDRPKPVDSYDRWAQLRKGRPPGTLNHATRELKEFLHNCLTHPRYTANFRKRLFAGELAPQLEMMAWHYCIGKPRERVQIEASIGVTSVNIATLTDSQLETIKDLLQGTARQRLEAAHEAEHLPEGDPPEPQP